MRRALVGVSLMSDSMEARAPSAVRVSMISPSEHEEGDHAGFLIMARTKGDGDRQRDQFIDGEKAAAQIHKGGQQNGIAQDDGSDHGAGRRHRVRGALEKPRHPVYRKRVDHEKQANERLRQGQHGMAVLLLVIVAAISAGRVMVMVLMFMPAQQ